MGCVRGVYIYVFEWFLDSETFCTQRTRCVQGTRYDSKGPARGWCSRGRTYELFLIAHAMTGYRTFLIIGYLLFVM